jgi:hypothetical protein
VDPEVYSCSANSTFALWGEVLYVTKSGAFFIHEIPYHSSDGESLVPYDEIQVLDWAEREEIDPNLIAEYVALEEA